MVFLAKSKPVETIEEHTNKLLVELNTLKKLYPNIPVNFELLELSCIYHDLGKMNNKFQEKVRHLGTIEGEIPHGALSTAFINKKNILNKGFSKKDYFILYNAVFHHHYRRSLFELTGEEIALQVEDMNKNLHDFLNTLENDEFEEIRKINKLIFYEEDRIYEEDDYFKDYIRLKGLLNRLDYAASAHISVELKNNFLIEELENFRKKSGFKWNPLQEYMRKNTDKNLIVIAETGMGKTEAGLLWIGQGKGFFTLPLKTAINAIYDRVKNKILDNNGKVKEQVGLLHSDTRAIYYSEESKDEDFELMDYYKRTKQLSMPLTISTVDQLFPFVFKYGGYESVLATLSYSKVIIDEIQMFSEDILGFLISGLKRINEIGGKFAIMTATLPGFLMEVFKTNGIEFDTPDVEFINENRNRHRIQLIGSQMDYNFIEKIIQSNRDKKMLIICNTIKECEKVYEQFKDEGANLFTSRFIKRDRKTKEKDILELGSRNCKASGIWITSSIAEASLDIDFDILITELSDLSGLFQRLGRVFRKRELLGQEINAYIFDGGEKRTSGVGTIINKEIFNLSKSALRKKFDERASIITEKEKMDLVRETFSMDIMKNTTYYKELKDYIRQTYFYLPEELSKSEAQKLFRNISSYTIIPKAIYEESEEEIIILSEVINNKSTDIFERVRSREKLMAFTMDIPDYLLKKMRIIDKIELGKYETISVINADYSFETGLRVKNEVEDSIF